MPSQTALSKVFPAGKTRPPEINENLPFMVRQDELRLSQNSWELAFFEGFGKEERTQITRAEGVVSTREWKH